MCLCIMFIAENLNQFKERFVDQLKNMLSADELGAFILVLANSQQDEFLKNELAADLKARFIELKNNFNAGKLQAAQDDLEVFKQLLDIELEEIPAWIYKTEGDWEIAFNAMRQLRPTRASAEILSSIRLAYDESKFHFNKPFLKPEILWEGDYQGKNVRALYNKFPFSDYHLLIVVSPEKNHPQLITKEMHQLVSSLVKSTGDIFPGFGVGFNSLAAGASVNHLHFQGFVRERKFPIENKIWKHNGGERSYPLTVRRFENVDHAWLTINELIKKDVAFNCLYRGNACYVVPRKFQGTVELPGWLMGAGWLDVAGVLTVSDIAVFDNLTAEDISTSLNLLA